MTYCENQHENAIMANDSVTHFHTSAKNIHVFQLSNNPKILKHQINYLLSSCQTQEILPHGLSEKYCRAPKANGKF